MCDFTPGQLNGFLITNAFKLSINSHQNIQFSNKETKLQGDLFLLGAALRLNENLSVTWHKN